MPFTRRSLLALCGGLCVAPLRSGGAVPAGRQLPSLSDVTFLTITARTIVPGARRPARSEPQGSVRLGLV